MACLWKKQSRKPAGNRHKLHVDAVEFVYDCDGEALSTTVTKEDASAFFGQDVKNCMTSARLTDELLHRAKLDAVERP